MSPQQLEQIGISPYITPKKRQLETCQTIASQAWGLGAIVGEFPTSAKSTMVLAHANLRLTMVRPISSQRALSDLTLFKCREQVVILRSASPGAPISPLKYPHGSAGIPTKLASVQRGRGWSTPAVFQNNHPNSSSRSQSELLSFLSSPYP